MEEASRALPHKILALSTVLVLVLSVSVPSIGLFQATMNHKTIQAYAQQGYAQSGEQNGWRLYDSPTMGIEISHPDSWHNDTTAVNYESSVALTTVKDSSYDEFQESVELVIETLPPTMSSDEYSDALINTLQAFEAESMESISPTTLAGHTAKMTQYTSKFYLDDSGYDYVNLKAKVVWTVVQDKAYTLFARAQSNDFDDYEQIFDQIIDSLEITNVHPAAAPKQFSEYVYSGYNTAGKGKFTIDHDSTWKINSDRQSLPTDTLVQFDAPYRGYVFYGAYAKVIVERGISDETTLEQYSANFIEQLEEELKTASFDLTDSRKTLVGGTPGYLISYTWNYGDVMYEGTEVWMLQSDLAYHFLIESEADVYDLYKNDLDHMLDSFMPGVAGDGTSSDDDNGNTTEEAFLTYENSDYGISVQYPESWSTYGGEDIAVGFLAPQDDFDDEFYETLIINAADSEVSFTLDELTKGSIATIRTFVEEFALTESKPELLDGHPAQYIHATGEQEETGAKMQIYSIWTLVDNRSYFLFFVGEYDKYEDQYAEIVQKMVGSFQIDETKLETGYSVYSNSELGVKIQYPGNWDVKEEFDFNEAPTVSFSDKDQYRFFAVNAIPLLWNMTAEEYSKIFPDELDETYDSLRIVESAPATLSGYPAYKIVFTGYVRVPEKVLPDIQPVAYTRTSTDASSVQIKSALILAVRDGMAYSVIYGTTVSGYLDFVNTANRIVDSVQIDTKSLSSKLVGTAFSDSESNLKLTLPSGWSGYRSAVGNVTTVTLMPSDPTDDAKVSIVVSIQNLMETLNDDEDEDDEEGKEESPCKPAQEAYVVQATDAIKMSLNDEECEIYGKDAKVRSYHAYTTEESVSIALLADSESLFDDNLPALEEVIESVQMEDAIDLSTDDYDYLFGITTSRHNVSALSGTSTIYISSTSNVTEVAFDEDIKKLSFKVDGKTGTSGHAGVVISTVLEGPYLVTIDGQTVEDFAILYDKTTNETSVTVDYSHSIHTITIAGTTVVPEFPLVVPPLMAAGGVFIIIWWMRARPFRR